MVTMAHFQFCLVPIVDLSISVHSSQYPGDPSASVLLKLSQYILVILVCVLYDVDR